MRLAACVLLVLLLAPGALAWPAEVRQSLGPAMRLRDGLLLGGAIEANSTGTAFGAAEVDGLFLGDGAVITACPAQEGSGGARCGGRNDVPNGHAKLRVLSGGVLVMSANGTAASLRTAAGAGLLGHGDLGNLTPPLDARGPMLALGGQTRAEAEGTSFVVLPFGRNVSIEVRGDAGIRRYNGTSTRFEIDNATGLGLEAPSAFLFLAPNATLRLGAAPLRVAEASTGLDDLYALLRVLTPPHEADRRADLTGAFGPFQVVPALLDGALAARRNLTLNGVPASGFVLVRAPDAVLALDNGTWIATGNATLVVQDDVLAPDPGSRVDPPLLPPLLLAALAIAGRVLTRRERTPWKRRRLVAALRALGLALLVLLAAQTLAPLLGFHPVWDAGQLSGRSRVQVGLLTTFLGLVAWLMVGLSLESLARSALAFRKRPAARLLPLAAGFVGAAIFLWLAAAPLTSLVARIVRL